MLLPVLCCAVLPADPAGSGVATMRSWGRALRHRQESAALRLAVVDAFTEPAPQVGP